MGCRDKTSELSSSQNLAFRIAAQTNQLWA
jgi:hypothetical protein